MPRPGRNLTPLHFSLAFSEGDLHDGSLHDAKLHRKRPFIVEKDGQEVDRIVGALPKAALEQRLAPALAG